MMVELLMAPMLVAISTLACRRWGVRIGGLVSAFPAIVGPVLLITATQHGAAFAARAADGTLLGLVGLSAFAVAYGRSAQYVDWRLSLAGGWIGAGVAALAAGMLAGRLAPPVGVAAAVISLLAAHRALPAASGPPSPPASWRGEVAVRMLLTATLVASLAGAVSRLGPLIGGMLAALPVLASVLAVFTHHEQGAGAAVALLRGMLVGMAGFVAFCEVIAVLIVPAGAGPAFAAASLSALIIQGLTACAPVVARRRPRPAS